MSQLKMTKVATPATPAANKSSIFIDTADNKAKLIDENAQVQALTLDGWRDRPMLMNGAMRWRQRQTAAATTLSSVGGRVYGLDRWCVSNENASVTVTQIDTIGAVETGLNTRFYQTVLKLTSTGKFWVGQVLPALDIGRVRGNIVRLSVNMKATASLTFRLGLAQLTAAGTVDTVPVGAGLYITAWGANTVDPTLGTALANLTPIAGSADGGSIRGNALDCAATTAWKRFSVCFTVPTDCKNLIAAIWTDSQAAAAAGVSFTEAALYEGPEVRPNFVASAPGLDLLECQRFYSKSFNVGTVPAASLTEANEGSGSNSLIGKAAATALAAVIPVVYPVRMFKIPTVTLFTPIAAGAVPYRVTGTTPAAQTAAATRGPTDRGIVVTATGDINGAVGDLVGVHWTADAEL